MATNENNGFHWLFPIEKEIYDKVSGKTDELYEKGTGHHGEWTEALKIVLSCIATEHSLETWGQGSKSEWLWDVCWIRRVGEQEWCKECLDVFLACEIEWSLCDEYILGDFLKLTVAKADYRLFIFSAENERHAEEIFRNIMNICPASEGARYMAIGIWKHISIWKANRNESLPYRAWTL